MDGTADPGAPTAGGDETGVLESLRRVDNHLADVVENQEQIADLLRQQRNGIGQVLEGLGGEADDFGASPSAFLFNMSVLVDAGTPKTDPTVETREIDYDGVVTEVRVVSVSAAQQAVGAQFGFNSGERVMPRDDPGDAEYVPLGSQPILTEPNVEVDEGEEIQFQFINNDDNDDHFATALVQIEERL